MRVDKAGVPVWRRFDGSYHWPRVLAIDLETGAEQTVYPRNPGGSDRALNSYYAGQIDISPDGRRLLVAETHAGRVLELDLEDGRPITG